MIGFKRYIRPGLAVSVIGHLAALIVGLFFVGLILSWMSSGPFFKVATLYRITISPEAVGVARQAYSAADPPAPDPRNFTPQFVAAFYFVLCGCGLPCQRWLAAAA
jgi:hypothetical protein